MYVNFYYFIKSTYIYVLYTLDIMYTLIYWFIGLTAMCSTGCFNGGLCTAPGVCTCPSEWTGIDCRQGM